jgi:hypothetical protein
MEVLHGSATTTEAVRREPEGAGQALWRQPEDRRRVEGSDLGRRFADRTEDAQVDALVSRGGPVGHRLDPRT